MKEFCSCGNYVVCGRKKYHPTELNSFLIGRPVIDYCIYCGKEKQHKKVLKHMKIEIIKIPYEEGGGFCARDLETLYCGDGETELEAVINLFELNRELNKR